MTAKQKANAQRFKKAIAEAKKLRSKNPKLTQAQAVKQAWAILYKGGKVTGTKTKKVTKKKATPKSYHKDTKSHNVRISVVSGIKINESAINEIKHINEMLHKWKLVLNTLLYDKKQAKDSLTKTLLKNDIYRVKNVINDLKKNLTNIKKHIK